MSYIVIWDNQPMPKILNYPEDKPYPAGNVTLYRKFSEAKIAVLRELRLRLRPIEIYIERMLKLQAENIKDYEFGPE